MGAALAWAVAVRVAWAPVVAAQEVWVLVAVLVPVGPAWVPVVVPASADSVPQAARARGLPVRRALVAVPVAAWGPVH
ncbi:hypothetical protein [Saccharopolyspora shandongensis]|uniref:hypothetical protein n=1 Tax=Saccharopolyspora shandongensis TaxID=418495 RepID=UPI0034032FDF